MSESTELKPCPFCGGVDFEIRENGRVWAGTKWGEPSSVSVWHHCEPIPGQPSRGIERVGRDRESAIAAWNRRACLAEGKAEPAPDDARSILLELLTLCDRALDVREKTPSDQEFDTAWSRARAPWYADMTLEDQTYVEAASPDVMRRLIAVARAAKAVGYSNGFDAAYPDKLERLRQSLSALESAGTREEGTR